MRLLPRRFANSCPVSVMPELPTRGISCGPRPRWEATIAEVSDRALVGQVVTGNIEAFEQLVRRHQLRIYRLCLNMLGSEGDAAEVTQDVFFTVWRTVGKFRGDSSFSTWLYRVATNHCLKFLRRGTLITVPLRDQAGSSGQPEGEFEARQTSKRVSEAVAALTPEQRAPLLLREVEGLGPEQIAEILGLTIAAVKSRLNRARVQLAMALEDAP